MRAQLRFNGDDYEDKANVDIDLKAPEGTYFIDEMTEPGVDAPEEGDRDITLQTDAGGRATAELRVKAVEPRRVPDERSDAHPVMVIAGLATTPDGKFRASATICRDATNCRTPRVVTGLRASVSPSGPLKRGGSFTLSATVAMANGADPSGVKIAFRARRAGAVLFAGGAEATTDANGAARISGRLARDVPDSETEEEVDEDVKDADDGSYSAAGISAAVSLLLSADESDDCAIKPGEDPLDRFLDRTHLADGYLKKHEDAGGHTIERHVGKDAEYLRERINARSPSELLTYIQCLKDLLGDAQTIRADMPHSWRQLMHEVNRSIYTLEEATAWLDRMIAVWERALAESEAGGSPYGKK